MVLWSAKIVLDRRSGVVFIVLNVIFDIVLHHALEAREHRNVERCRPVYIPNECDMRLQWGTEPDDERLAVHMGFGRFLKSPFDGDSEQRNARGPLLPVTLLIIIPFLPL